MTSERRTLVVQEVYKYDKLCLYCEHEVIILSEGDAYCQAGTKTNIISPNSIDLSVPTTDRERVLSEVRNEVILCITQTYTW